MNKGYTLIELLITISLIFIIITIAVPSFNSTMSSIRTRTLVDTLVSALNLARSEAVSRNERITLCASTDGKTCLNNAENWNGGMIMTHKDALITSKVLKVWQFGNSKSEISLKNHNNLYLIYTARGNAKLTRDGVTFLNPMPEIVFNLQVSECSGYLRRKIKIAPVGSVEITKVNCE